MIALLAANVPIVVMHGLNSNSDSMDHMAEVIRANLDAIVINCEVGNGAPSTIVMTMEDQVEELAKCISSHAETAEGFIGVGHSQGAYLLRSYLQQKSHIYSPMLRLVSIAGPLGGFYCGNHSLCGNDTLPFLIKHFVYENVYEDYIQNNIGPAEYWRDPYQEDNYYAKAHHLPVIDNSREYQEVYKRNFMSVDKIVLFGSPNDGVISPWQSSFFGYWKKGSDKNVVTYDKRSDYKDDLFGLRSMVEQGRVEFIETTYQHTQYTKDDNFIVKELIPWLVLQQ